MSQEKAKNIFPKRLDILKKNWYNINIKRGNSQINQKGNKTMSNTTTNEETMSKKKTVQHIPYVKALSNVLENDKVVSLLDEETVIALTALRTAHEKKNNNGKPSSAKEKDEMLKQQILAYLGDGQQRTATDIQNAVGASNQKVSYLLTKMVKDDKTVIRTEEKRKIYFSIA